MRAARIRFRILPLTRDLRAVADTAGLEQARADATIEAEWRRRVRENRKERAALSRRIAEVSR